MVFAQLEREQIRESPSSRRAWIEIQCRWLPVLWPVVALLAEGVDRNLWKLMNR